MRGIAILTEGRSGSNWLGSLTNATGLMGKSEEWLGSDYLRFKPSSYEALEEAAIKKGATDNGRFAIKVFPRHLDACKDTFGKDFLFETKKKHDLLFILLERRDRLRQAISFYRARMSGLWTSQHQGRIAPRIVPYSFAGISQAYFQIDRSYAYWRSYVALLGVDCLSFVYEDLQPDPKPYLQAVAQFMAVTAPESTSTSKFTIQRDSLTEEWLARFREDVAAKGAIEGIGDAPVTRNLDNLVRFIRKRPLNRKRF
ncbi:Stf0 family sulfotransferase [Mesorhizobium sp. CO1-1-9]|uniref:Stf0 family sulfotransferase n=1 Tax=Mesorhizobium sp. CO1-1-9 TaxID=2876630 RepID=UPI001CCEC36D|nr:Stf0 family sulfotransferase [Mesorhizobium sp. CO1-1-9]MBZ9693945.1 Stf0 sulfotransferase [Mesorhizobium sp. CO1-1-9]